MQVCMIPIHNHGSDDPLLTFHLLWCYHCHTPHIYLLGKRNKLPNEAVDHKIPIWTICGFLNDDRKTEARNYMVQHHSTYSSQRKLPSQYLDSWLSQGCLGNPTCWLESIKRYSFIDHQMHDRLLSSLACQSLHCSLTSAETQWKQHTQIDWQSATGLAAAQTASGLSLNHGRTACKSSKTRALYYCERWAFLSNFFTSKHSNWV